MPDAPEEAGSPASDWEQAVGGTEEPYVLRLYVAGSTRRSRRAIENAQRLCEEHLSGRHELEVIDILAHPEQARQEQIVASPTLIRGLPLPFRRLVGDLSQMDDVLVGLDLRARNRPGDARPDEGQREQADDVR